MGSGISAGFMTVTLMPSNIKEGGMGSDVRAVGIGRHLFEKRQRIHDSKGQTPFEGFPKTQNAISKNAMIAQPPENENAYKGPTDS